LNNIEEIVNLNDDGVLANNIEIPRLQEIQRAPPVDDFMRVFLMRNFEVMPVSPFVRRIQRFEFRRASIELMDSLYNQWLTRQVSHQALVHQNDECDACGTNVEDLAVVAPLTFRTLILPVPFNIPSFLKHISCGHTICSTCLITKRLIFVNFGLPICCNTGGTCWLQF
jgi:hypothetical protein